MPPFAPISRPVTPIVVQSHPVYYPHHVSGDVSLTKLLIVSGILFVFTVASFAAMVNPYVMYYANRYLDWCFDTERKWKDKQ